MLAISYIIITLTGLFIATVIDVRQRRIPNWLTVGVSVVGLTHNLIIKGWTGFGEHTLAMLFGLILFFVFYLLGAFGAGDAKMMAALGAVMGFPFIFIASMLIILIGGMISFAILLKNRGFKNVMFFLYTFLRALFTGKLKDFNEGVSKTSKNTFPFSVAITIGSVITLWYIYPSL